MDKQRDILEAALKLFAAYGFHATPTSRIAKEAGVANGTLFHYYKTKEDLIVSLYIDIKTRMGAHTDAADTPGVTIKERFRNQYIGVLKWFNDNKDEFHFIQQFHTSPFAALLPPEEIKRQLGKSCSQIEEAMQQKAIQRRDVDFILTLLSSHTFGLSQYLAKTKLTGKEREKVISDSFDMLWGMLS